MTHEYLCRSWNMLNNEPFFDEAENELSEVPILKIILAILMNLWFIKWAPAQAAAASRASGGSWRHADRFLSTFEDGWDCLFSLQSFPTVPVGYILVPSGCVLSFSFSLVTTSLPPRTLSVSVDSFSSKYIIFWMDLTFGHRIVSFSYPYRHCPQISFLVCQCVRRHYKLLHI